MFCFVSGCQQRKVANACKLILHKELGTPTYKHKGVVNTKIHFEVQTYTYLFANFSNECG